MEVVEHAEPLDARQVDAYFFERFADRRRQEIRIGWLAPPAGKRNLSRPRVSDALGPMNEQDFEPFAAIVQNNRDGGGNHPSLKWNFNGLVLAQLEPHVPNRRHL
jgi:hypothetical protein